MHTSDAQRLATWSDRFAARMAGSAKDAGARMRPGLPRSIGSAERGEELLGGLYRLGGQIVDGAGLVLWDALPKGPEALREAHGFAWLDDLAAMTEPEAAETARAWTRAWIERFGDGRGHGWVADIAGRRALRMVHYGELLEPLSLAPCLARHVAFLARRASSVAAGLPRVEALAGLYHAASALDANDVRATRALAELEPAADALIDRYGGVQSRSPEALARALLLLGWTAETAFINEREPGPSLTGALARAAPVLRSLLHGDGRLPRFHGGGAASGVADAALAVAGRRGAVAPKTLAMGFARLRHGRTSIVLDAAVPPVNASETAHASSLSLEVTVGGRPIIVNCGPGARFGPRWGRASRATASHSTLAIDGFSSSRFARDGRHMTETVGRVLAEREETDGGTRFVTSHDGYLPTHGLRHERTVELSRDGRDIQGEDALVATDGSARRRFDRARRSGPVRFAVRFHLDPAVEASLDAGGRAVSLLLSSGAVWVIRTMSNDARLRLEPSVVFPSDTLEPVATKQVAVFSSAVEYATRIAWKLAEVPRHGLWARDAE